MTPRTTRITALAFAALAFSVAVMASAPQALALDSVRYQGTDRTYTALGTIEQMTPTEVVIVNNISKKKDSVPVNAILEVRLDEAPSQMTLLNSAIRQGNYNRAGELVDQLEAQEGIKNPRVRDELVFFRALVTSQNALGGSDPAALKKARDAMEAFLKQYPTSWHYFEAVTIMGNLYLAIAPAESGAVQKEAYDRAVGEYAKLGQAPWVDYKMRAAISQGHAEKQRGSFTAAQTAYNSAITLGTGKDEDPLIGPQLLTARVGLADTLAETSPAKGIEIINGVIAKADAENTRLHAMAFTTLGKCYLKSKDDKKALMNYLKVDVLYFSFPEYHAEALLNLSNLWNKTNRPERAKAAEQLLKARYPSSVQAAKLGS